MNIAAQLGHLLFRTRNIVFPIILLLVLATFPPVALMADSQTVLTLGLGLAVLLAGQGLRVLTIGLDYIRRGGKNGRIYADRLVTGGLFGCCRNPMYTGNVLMILGFLILSANWKAMVVGALLGWLIYRSIIASEEQFLHQTFGSSYADYCANVPRWLPAYGATRQALSQYRFDWPSVVIREYGTLFTTVLIALALIASRAWRAGVLSSFLPALACIALATAMAYASARYLKKTRRLRPLERS